MNSHLGPDLAAVDANVQVKPETSCGTACQPIPKRIIQTGKALPGDVKTRAMVSALRLLHPDYEYLFFDDAQVADFVSAHFPQYRSVFDSFSVPIQKYDFFRYLAVYKLGGFYFDLDVLLASNLSGLLDYGCVFPFEGITLSEYLRAQYGMGWEIGNYGFGASPAHPFLNAIIENCVRAQRDPAWARLAVPKYIPFSREENNVLFTTGPGLVSRTLAECPELGGTLKVLFPDDATDPANWYCFGNLGVHLMASSWRPKGGFLRRKLKANVERWRRHALLKQDAAFGKTDYFNCKLVLPLVQMLKSPSEANGEKMFRSALPITTSTADKRVLLFSLRNAGRNDLFRCPHYEFEDTICEIDTVEMVAPAMNPASMRNEIAERLAFRAPILLKPDIPKIEVRSHYDLFFAICGFPRDLLALHATSDLWKACSIKVCLIDELWVNQMERHRFFLDVLKNFDLVVLYYSQSVDPLSERIGRKCVFIPPGIDALRFCSLPGELERSVDVYSVGRRSETTHQAILRMAEKHNLLYLHDTIKGNQAIHSREHRQLYANIAKRSKYFLVYPGLIDQPDRRGGQIEIGNRYFEGAAAGTVLIGEIPSNGEFNKLFDWPDCVIQLPYGSDQIEGIIQILEADPVRQERIRCTNIAQVLRKHDWVYRWEAILNAVGITPLPQLEARKSLLHGLAEQVANDEANAAASSLVLAAGSDGQLAATKRVS